MILVNLFAAFFKVGLFAIGGAYSFLPLIEKEVVQTYHWLTKEEFMDVLGIVKVFPGAISIKYATYTGYKIGGIPGAIVANVGNMLAPLIILTAAYGLYSRYKDLPLVSRSFGAIQLAVFAMIIAVAFQIINPTQLTQPRNLAIVVIAFILFIYTRIDPAVIIILAGITGIVLK